MSFRTISLATFLSLSTVTASLAGPFTVTVPSADNGVMGERQAADVFGCSGRNLSPAIAWKEAPKGTKSFVVTMYDPDAPTGSGFWHWVAVDIPASVKSLDEGAGTGKGQLPEAARMMRSDAGMSSYLGPCPPEGESHRYVITVKALNVEKLDLPADASAAMVGFMSNMNAIGQTSITLKAGR